MIGFFPTPYPDELLYSVLSRYYDKSGYTFYVFAAEDLFVSKTVRPDIEFLNQYTDDALAALTNNMSIEDVIMEHTMFPYYARFLPYDKRKNALEALRLMKTNYRNLMSIPKNKEGLHRYLRYCPICAKDDRKEYGEAYWHRNHQIMDVDICPIHLCRLLNSDVVISGKTSPALISAEVSIVHNYDALLSENNTEIAVARYINDVFQESVDTNFDITIGDFLHSRMESTRYLSVRGEQRNIALLCNDFFEYYKELKRSRLTERWQIEKVLSNHVYTTYDVCLLAMFLNISVHDLTNMSLPEKSQAQIFDERVNNLRKQGLSYPEIARILNAPLETVKTTDRHKTYHKKKEQPLKSGVKSMDWNKYDGDMLPRVKEVIQKVRGNEADRPQRITIGAIERMLGIPCKRIDNMPLCKAEIQKYYESYPEYWAREAVWAAIKVIDNGQPFNWKNIRNLTNMRRKDFESCLQHLAKYADKELVLRIKGLLT